MAEAGRPTELTEEVMRKIKQGILDGLMLKEIAQQSQINEKTLYDWTGRNYQNLADLVEGWKRDRKLLLADKNIEAILQLPTYDKDFVRTVADMSKFVKETLDKTNYSKRTETTGEGGGPIKVESVSDAELKKFLTIYAGNTTKEDSNTEESI